MHYQTIISVADLARNLNTPNWLILDCRCSLVNFQESYQHFSEKHIPNARHCCIHYELHSESICEVNDHSSSNYTLVLAEFKEDGFDKNVQIVIYDADDGELTNEIWLYLRSLGFQNVAVLQGGINAWKACKYPTQSI